VDAHGGWIRVENEVGKGKTFVFSLPFESPRQDAITAWGECKKGGSYVVRENLGGRR
jgi:hypothetical protein